MYERKPQHSPALMIRTITKIVQHIKEVLGSRMRTRCLNVSNILLFTDKDDVELIGSIDRIINHKRYEVPVRDLF